MLGLVLRSQYFLDLVSDSKQGQAAASVCQSRHQHLPTITPHRPVNEHKAVLDLFGVMIPEPLPDRIQVHCFTMKELFDLAISFAAFEVANASEVINGVGGVEAFVIE